MDDTETGRDTGLPASLEVAWGLRERPTKGPRRGLSAQRIVEAGVAVAGAEGLGAVSMARVATELGSSAMSLYRYFAAKDELLALMIDHACGPAPDLSAERGWRAGLARWSRAYLDRLRANPWILQVPIEGPPATPHQIGWLEHGLAALAGTGLRENEKLSVMLLLSGFVRNDATLRFSLESAATSADSSLQEAMVGYRALLGRITGGGRFPALTRVVEDGVMDRADDPDDEFVFGLDRILDGIEALVRTRA